ncbi:nitroreductase family protein [Fusobacterium sp.]|uniref:nitroreductase family protein n=1 Tax=Fusobacterium sp. TaxID=68766 RepID=UPI00396C87C3
MILEILKKIRSHRSFTQHKVTLNELRYMVEGARYAASAKNSQKIRYVLVSDEKLCNDIFAQSKFAGAIKWKPELGESPRGYILMCTESPFEGNENLFYFDMGLAAQNILLIADELGYKGCIVAAFNKKEVEKLLELENNFTSYILIALGEPKDNVTVVPSVMGNTTYSRIKNEHYVPKLPLDEIIIKEK